MGDEQPLMARCMDHNSMDRSCVCASGWIDHTKLVLLVSSNFAPFLHSLKVMVSLYYLCFVLRRLVAATLLPGHPGISSFFYSGPKK